jgi:hypothetical protein
MPKHISKKLPASMSDMLALASRKKTKPKYGRDEAPESLSEVKMPMDMKKGLIISVLRKKRKKGMKV